MSNKELTTAVEAALEAGKMIRASVGRVKTLRYKGAINIVTDVDLRAEDLIVRRLKKAFPGYGILAEERPEEPRGRAKWIIDPLDGTTNFSRGFPFFGVSIALEKDGEIVCGAVYDPVHEELFTALRGQGVRLNSRKIAVSGSRRLDKAFLATGFSYRFREKRDNNIANFRKFSFACLAVRRAGAACLDLCYTACGRFDGYWEMDLSPWDTAAGALIVREAGGRVTRFDGAEFKPYDKTIVASNGRIHESMIDVLRRKRRT